MLPNKLRALLAKMEAMLRRGREAEYEDSERGAEYDSERGAEYEDSERGAEYDDSEISEMGAE